MGETSPEIQQMAGNQIYFSDNTVFEKCSVCIVEVKWGQKALQSFIFRMIFFLKKNPFIQKCEENSLSSEILSVSNTFVHIIHYDVR